MMRLKGRDGTEETANLREGEDNILLQIFHRKKEKKQKLAIAVAKVGPKTARKEKSRREKARALGCQGFRRRSSNVQNVGLGLSKRGATYIKPAQV